MSSRTIYRSPRRGFGSSSRPHARHGNSGKRPAEQERELTFYDFAATNQAAADAVSGATIKPLLCMPLSPLTMMDEADIDLKVLSHTMHWLQQLDAKTAVPLARRPTTGSTR